MSKIRQKIWPNKNSRLRFFYFRRYFYRYRFSISRTVRKFFVQKNMKWRKLRKTFFFLTVQKKYKRPHPSKYKEEMIWYKYIFTEMISEKKKIRAFYGIKKHKQLLLLYRKFFKKKKYFQKTIFLNSFESKVDIILVRAKFLPTIFSSRFLIQTYGVLVNGKVCKDINYRLKIGDIVHFDFIFWRLLIAFIYYKIFLRYEIFFFYSFYKKIKNFSEKKKIIKQPNLNYFSFKSLFFLKKKPQKFVKKNKFKRFFRFNKFRKRHSLLVNKKIRTKLDKILGFHMFTRKTENFEDIEDFNENIYFRYRLLKQKYKKYLNTKLWNKKI